MVLLFAGRHSARPVVGRPFRGEQEPFKPQICGLSLEVVVVVVFIRRRRCWVERRFLGSVWTRTTPLVRPTTERAVGRIICARRALARPVNLSAQSNGRAALTMRCPRPFALSCSLWRRANISARRTELAHRFSRGVSAASRGEEEGEAVEKMKSHDRLQMDAARGSL